AGLRTVIVAIVIPEVPRVVRLVRSVVLSLREEPYVEAAVALGARTPVLLMRHVLPNTLAPLIVQATFVCASAILVEAILSFLGVGIPPETPTWGNIMAEGRALFRVFPHNILFPGVVLGDEGWPLSLTSDKSMECYRNWWPGPGDDMVALMNRSIDLLEELARESDNLFRLNRRGYLFATADPGQVPVFVERARE